MTQLFLSPQPPTPEQLIQIQKLDEDANRARAAARESFDRCDTDGFLSQWASGMTAQKNEMEKEILANGGLVRVRVLVDSAGEIVSDQTRVFPNRNAPWTTVRLWDVRAHADRLGRRWIPVGERSRVQKSLGVREEFRWTPGYAKVTAPEGSRGLSGAASAFVGIFRADRDELTY